jgi:hypothetical protein
MAAFWAVLFGGSGPAITAHDSLNSNSNSNSLAYRIVDLLFSPYSPLFILVNRMLMMDYSYSAYYLPCSSSCL